MPTFATDRDLIILEPNLFRDIGWAGQTLIKGSGTVASAELTVDALDLQARGTTTGMVALVGGLPLEITGFVNPSRARVSLIRDDLAAAARPPFDIAATTTTIATFGPQIALAHAHILRTLGVEPAGSTIPDAITETRITNPRDLALLESLFALHAIYSAASALLGPDSAPGRRARFYADRFAQERFRVVARIDTDGDGLADVLRRAGVVHLTRV